MFYKTLVPNLLHGACQNFILQIYNKLDILYYVKKCKVFYTWFTVGLQVVKWKENGKEKAF